MRLQTDRAIEIVRLERMGTDGYRETRDPDNPALNAPAINEGKDFAPDFEAKKGDLLLIKVLE